MALVPQARNAVLKDRITYFRHLVPLSMLTELEGCNLGDALVESVLAAQKKEHLKRKHLAGLEDFETFCSRNAAMRELVAVNCGCWSESLGYTQHLSNRTTVCSGRRHDARHVGVPPLQYH